MFLWWSSNKIVQAIWIHWFSWFYVFFVSKSNLFLLLLACRDYVHGELMLSPSRWRRWLSPSASASALAQCLSFQSCAMLLYSLRYCFHIWRTSTLGKDLSIAYTPIPKLEPLCRSRLVLTLSLTPCLSFAFNFLKSVHNCWSIQDRALIFGQTCLTVRSFISMTFCLGQDQVIFCHLNPIGVLRLSFEKCL